MINKLTYLVWLLVAALLAYPAATSLYPLTMSWLIGLGFEPAPTPFGWAFSLALPLAVLVVLGLAPGRLRSFGTVGPRNAVVTVAFWTIGALILWIVLRYLTGSLETVGRAFAGTLAVTLGAALASAFVPRWGGVLAGAAFAAGLATLALLPASLFPLPSPEISALVSSGKQPALLSFAAAGLLAALVLSLRIGAGGAWWRQAIVAVVWTIALHVLWVVALYLSGQVVALPQWVPLLTGTVMVLVGAIVPLALLLRTGRMEIGKLLTNPALVENPATQAVLTPGPSRGGRRAWIISYTGVSNEPRVLRQTEALLADGWDVTVCGYDGHSRRPEEWTFVRLPTQEAYRSSVLKLLQPIRALSATLAARGPTSLRQRAALFHHHTVPLWMHTRRQLLELLEREPELKPDLVLSHDWHTADVGYALAQRSGAKFSIDCHEYAPGQYFNDPQWVKRQRPITVAVQDFYLRQADVITVVCEGIANLLAAESPLKRPPVVVRSVPFKNVQGFRPVGERIVVLYHGDLSRRREIHTAIASVRFWREDIDLLLRGSGDPAYMGELKRLVERYNLGHRVTFEPPVPFDRIVPEANRADIGFFSFTGDSPQIRFTLPNKLFEYVMAGLALCISDQEEVGRIVRRYGNGKLIEQHSPEGIADAINAFTREEIEACKKASIAAAEDLNWEAERAVMLGAYRAILAP